MHIPFTLQLPLPRGAAAAAVRDAVAAAHRHAGNLHALPGAVLWPRRCCSPGYGENHILSALALALKVIFLPLAAAADPAPRGLLGHRADAAHLGTFCAGLLVVVFSFICSRCALASTRRNAIGIAVAVILLAFLAVIRAVGEARWSVVDGEQPFSAR
jgi:hypothetical protein